MLFQDRDLQDELLELQADFDLMKKEKSEEIEELKDLMDDLNSDASAVEELAKREKEKVENLKEQERLKEQRKAAYNVGDMETVARINKILAPDEPGR